MEYTVCGSLKGTSSDAGSKLLLREEKCAGGSGFVGGFFLRVRIFAGMFDEPFPTCDFNGRSACAHYPHSLGHDQSTLAQGAEMTVGERRTSV